ncbi:MAG: MBL fold metallo-hydrolase [Deltaproteobacteria bacterium]|nr:MBL fold metallo-hydrolase [Deltaproteobacteria bacterium]MBW2119868.1 MBL fold metallo-hydrolase [Deltaproteobacteria bacterium]
MYKVTEGVYFIQGQDEFIPDSHVYVIGKPGTGDLSVIDAGLMGKGRYKIDSIVKEGIELSDIKRVIMTHTHLDHIGCLAEIIKEIPHAELWVHKSEAEPLEQGDEKTVWGMDMFQSMCQTQYGIKPGAFKFKVDRKLEGGETLNIGDMAWEVLHIPGHSQGSIGLYYRPEKILIPGDVVYADYAIGRFDLYGASGAQHRESLLSLAELDVAILLPGHNSIVEDVKPGYIMETAKQWEPYLI